MELGKVTSIIATEENELLVYLKNSASSFVATKSIEISVQQFICFKVL